MKNLSRRDFLKISAAGAAGVMTAAALGGCSSGSGSDAPASGGSDEAGAAAEGFGSGERQDELVAGEDAATGILPEITYGTNFALSSLTPFRNTSGQHIQTFKHLYDRLVYLNGDYEYRPQAAKSVEVEADGVTFDIELYDFITDSEGTNITAADVVWFIEQYMENGMKSYFGYIVDVEQTGDYTLKVVFSDDIAEVSSMAFHSTYIVSRAAYEASADGFASYVVSTSPYIVTEFTAAASLTMERRDDYWMPEELWGKYYTSNIQTVNEIVISETSQMQIALETGAVDAFPSISAEVVNAFVGDDKYYVCSAPSNNGYCLFFTGDAHSPLADDVNLRKALCYAVDPQGIIDGALSGYGEPMYDICCRTSTGYVKDWDNREYFPYSPQTAQEYLAQSDYSGQQLVFTLPTNSKDVGTILQAYWQAVGINVTLDVLDSAMFSAVVPGEYDIYMTSTGNGCANLWSQFFDGNAFSYSFGPGDRQAHQDKELTELLYYTWQNANYTEENIDKVHEYLMDVCYCYGVALPYTVNVISNDTGIVSTAYNIQGYVDLVNCQYAAR